MESRFYSLLKYAYPDEEDELLRISAQAGDAIVDTLAERESLAELDWIAEVHDIYGQVSHNARESGAVRPVACHEGCHWCCHNKVVCTAPEVLYLAEMLRQSRGPDALARLGERVRAAAEHSLAHTDWRNRPRHTCPLLVDERCSVYEFRPLICRGVTSLDAEACRRDFGTPRETIPYEAMLQVISSAFGLGVQRATEDTGRQGELVDMHVALHIALSEPAITARWVAGEDVFRSARDEVQERSS